MFSVGLICSLLVFQSVAMFYTFSKIPTKIDSHESSVCLWQLRTVSPIILIVSADTWYSLSRVSNLTRNEI